MPLLGFGVFQITDAVVCEQSVVDAIGTGYRLIDTAASYLNEVAVGRGIRRSDIAREEHQILANPALLAVATKHKKTVAQVILRWISQRGIAVLSKSVHKERMAENFNVLDFTLSADDMATIATLDTGTGSFFDHRDPEKVKWLGTRVLDV